MVSVGFRALPQRNIRRSVWREDILMGGEYDGYNHGKRNKGMNRKSNKGHNGSEQKIGVGHGRNDDRNSRKFSKNQNYEGTTTSHIRKQADPEAVKYFSEISNLFESNSVDVDERSVICGNALEEARGKEVELSTDYIISHTLQTLLEGCDIDHLCNFLINCGRDLSLIATDKSGSHVIETALKSLASHLQDSDTWPTVEDTLRKICEMLAESPLDVMFNCYGSHVLRRLLCLCKGVSLDSPEFHGRKSRSVLAERLNLKASRSDENSLQHVHQGFPELLKFLVFEILRKSSKKDISAMLVDQQCSLVLQTALRMLAGLDSELMRAIQILLGISSGIGKGETIDVHKARKFLNLMKDTAFSHLMEVILQVAPDTVYDELLTSVFRNALVDLSLDNCGNFVVQALIAHARNKEHMELIWTEISPCFKDLLATGKPGVIASLVSASQRLDTHGHECCKALAAAVADESPMSVVPRLLFLESYFYCNDKANWKWPSGVKMHLMGSMILQTVFRYPSVFTQPFINSITGMEVEYALDMAKDASGSRVLEAFLSSNASGKHKRKIVAKLKGHFGELSMKPSSSFTVEKCFSVSNLSLKEMITSELLAMRKELSKTREGPYLLMKFDADGYARQPEQWRSRLKTKETVLNDFYDTFGPGDKKDTKTNHFLSSANHTTTRNSVKSSADQITERNSVKSLRMEIDHSLSTTPNTNAKSSNKRSSSDKGENAKHATDDHRSKKRKKKHDGKA
uniref:Uncharacterized protein n=1 Tax=Kalanchoe fedtschenkoi TaxID=63787 RepID=A0A7N0TNN1_KALFE